MKHGELRAIGHNLADSLARGVCFVIGHFDTDVYGEAALSPGGALTIDFLGGRVTAAFMEQELCHWAIFRDWEARFHRGVVTAETHPGHGGINATYDALGAWLDDQIALLQPLTVNHKAAFRVLEGQETLPPGILRELEVSWT
jgi:hypothetical protein